MSVLAKVPWRLVGPLLGMVLVYLGAQYAQLDPCNWLWPDRCAPLTVQAAPRGPAVTEAPDAGQ